LKIPLGLLAVRGRWQCDDAADPRVHALRDAFDGAALAGAVSSLEQDYDLQALVHDPVLQLHKFALQQEQFAEISAAIDRILFVDLLEMPQGGRNAGVVDLLFQLFVEIVLKFQFDP
jgi:hypothetical protein